MQNVRRAALMGLALVAGLALTGCRTQVGTAAFVGNDRLTESDVDGIIADANAKVSDGTHAPLRSDVVFVFVVRETCEKVQAERKFASAQVDATALAAQIQVPANSTFAEDHARMQACMGGLLDDVKKANSNPPDPTEAELHDIFNRAQAAGFSVPPFEALEPQLAADARTRQAVAVSRALTTVFKDANVSVSPRYRPLELPVDTLDSGVPLVFSQMGEPGSDAIRPPAPTASPAP